MLPFLQAPGYCRLVMPRYIRLNSLKQSFREDLRIAHSWKVIFLWIPKLLRKRLDFTSAFPVPFPFRDFQISGSDVSPQAAATLAPRLAEGAGLGFGTPLYQRFTTLRGENVTTSAVCRHRDGQIVLRLVHLHLGT